MHVWKTWASMFLNTYIQSHRINCTSNGMKWCFNPHLLVITNFSYPCCVYWHETTYNILAIILAHLLGNSYSLFMYGQPIQVHQGELPLTLLELPFGNVRQKTLQIVLLVKRPRLERSSTQYSFLEQQHFTYYQKPNFQITSHLHIPITHSK